LGHHTMLSGLDESVVKKVLHGFGVPQ